MKMKRQPQKPDPQRDADLRVIKEIAQRAVSIYDEQNVSVDHIHIMMDLMACHFSCQKLRLDDLLAADAFDFIHDITGINRHLDRENYQLMNGFSPRFSKREPKTPTEIDDGMGGTYRPGVIIA